jgi:hypothetical protein
VESRPSAALSGFEVFFLVGLVSDLLEFFLVVALVALVALIRTTGDIFLVLVAASAVLRHGVLLEARSAAIAIPSISASCLNTLLVISVRLLGS